MNQAYLDTTDLARSSQLAVRSGVVDRENSVKWLHQAATDESEATTDQWRLRAYQDVASSDWYGAIERLALPHDRPESAAFDSAMEARKWRQAELAHWPSRTRIEMGSRAGHRTNDDTLSARRRHS